MAEFPAPREGIALTHFIVSDDVERARRFYTDVLGGKTVYAGEPSIVALANSWIIINVGGGPTDDKPTVTLETPPDPDRASSFLNIRVADIQAVYDEWSARGAEFLIVTHWASIESIRSFAGSNTETAVVPEKVREMMIEYDHTVRHYEVVE